MPSKNVVKTYVAGGIYHVYNQGVERRTILMDTQDYVMFRHYLKSYLLAPDHPGQRRLPHGLEYARSSYDLHQRIALLAFCLLPDRFDLVLRQQDDRAMPQFLKRLSNAYVRYFNFRYERVGTLFQGPYRAKLLEPGLPVLVLTRALHRAPLAVLAGQGLSTLEEYPYSSYPEYLGRRTTEWLHPGLALEHLLKLQAERPELRTYQQFLEAEEPGEAAAQDAGSPRAE